jgi:hypothetical protein
VDEIALRTSDGSLPAGVQTLDGNLVASSASWATLPGNFVLDVRSFSVHVIFRTASDLAGGFLFSHSDVSGRFLNVALELLGDRTVLLHYVSRDVADVVNFTLPVPVTDAHWHTLSLTVSNSIAVVGVDGLPFRARVLRGPVQDCQTHCVLLVARAAGVGRRPLLGFVRQVRVYLRRAVSSVVPVASPAEVAPRPRSLQLLSVEQAAPVFDGNYTVENTAFGSLAAHSVPGVFSIAATVLQERGTAGYIVAKTNSDGSVRYFAVYSDAVGVHLYYKTVGSDQLQLVSWPKRIDNGLFRRVFVAVRGARATLFVDGEKLATMFLVDFVTDCVMPSENCRLIVGGRAAPGGNTAAFPWNGQVVNVALVAGLALPFDPQPVAPLVPLALPIEPLSGAPFFDLLDTSRHAYSGNVNVAHGAFYLHGKPDAILETSHDFSLGRNFTLAFTLQVQPNSSGYIYAKSDAAGKYMYLSVYYNAKTRSIVLTYRGREQLELWTGALDSAPLHLLVVSVSGLTVTVSVDTVVTATKPLVAYVTDCGNAFVPECVLFLGQKSTLGPSNGASRLSMRLILARVYPRTVVSALQVFDLPRGPFNFLVTPKKYVIARNDGGSFPGTSRAACASRCNDDPLCLVRLFRMR